MNNYPLLISLLCLSIPMFYAAIELRERQNNTFKSLCKEAKKFSLDLELYERVIILFRNKAFIDEKFISRDLSDNQFIIIDIKGDYCLVYYDGIEIWISKRFICSVENDLEEVIMFKDKVDRMIDQYL